MYKGTALLYRVPTEIQKHNSMIFHDQQYNFHDYLMHSLKPPLLAASSPLRNAETAMYLNKYACRLYMHFEIIKT